MAFAWVQIKEICLGNLFIFLSLSFFEIYSFVIQPDILCNGWVPFAFDLTSSWDNTLLLCILKSKIEQNSENKHTKGRKITHSLIFIALFISGYDECVCVCQFFVFFFAAIVIFPLLYVVSLFFFLVKWMLFLFVCCCCLTRPLSLCCMVVAICCIFYNIKFLSWLPYTFYLQNMIMR